MRLPWVIPHGLRMNRAHDIGKEVIIVGAAAAFACKADFSRKVLQDIECDMAHYGHIFSGMVLADAAVVLSECHIQTPVQ